MAESPKFTTVQQYLDRGSAAPTSSTSITGTVDVTNRLARQLGIVSVSSMPAVSISGTVPISGGISVLSLAQQTITGLTDPGIGGDNLIVDYSLDYTNSVKRIVHKKIASALYSPLLYQNLGASVVATVKGTAGNVFSFSCYSVSPQAVGANGPFVQLHNVSGVGSLTSGVSVPMFSFSAPPKVQVNIGTDIFTNEGCYFSNGIKFAWSSTCNVYTTGPLAANQSTFIQYV